MTLAGYFVKAVLVVITLAMVRWFLRATWRARLWAGLLWVAVMAILLAVVQW